MGAVWREPVHSILYLPHALALAQLHRDFHSLSFLVIVLNIRLVAHWTRRLFRPVTTVHMCIVRPAVVCFAVNALLWNIICPPLWLQSLWPTAVIPPMTAYHWLPDRCMLFPPMMHLRAIASLRRPRHLDDLVPLSFTVDSYQKIYGSKEAGYQENQKIRLKCLKVAKSVLRQRPSLNGLKLRWINTKRFKPV